MVYRDRQGQQIDVLRWADLWEDFAYRLVREDFVVPTTTQVRTMWEGVDDVAGAMYTTGQSTDGVGWTDVGTAYTEAEAIAFHTACVNDCRARLA